MAQAGMTYSQQVNTARMSAEQASALTNLNQGTCAITLIRTWPTPSTRLTVTTRTPSPASTPVSRMLRRSPRRRRARWAVTRSYWLRSRGVLLERLKFIPEDAVRGIGEFWLRYGYAMNSPVVPPGDFRCMEHFTYWKMAEMNISRSTMPETFRQTIRGIFEKGVTV